MPDSLARSGSTLLRFGLVTDAHSAVKAPANGRYYADSRAKMAQCVAALNPAGLDFLIELGDLKDELTPASEASTLEFLRDIEAELAGFDGPRYHVLGNHDVDSISKQQFLAAVENTGISTEHSYYSFDGGGVRCIVLDANFRSDGSPYQRGCFDWTDANLPAEQCDWLRGELATAPGPVLVFVHQLLDGAGDYWINNAPEVRELLAADRKVLAVFHGHYHPGRHSAIDGVHYFTQRALVEGPGLDNNAFSIVEVGEDLSIRISGFGQARTTVLLPID